MLDEPIEISGQTYRVHKRLNAFDQLHVARRVAPLVTAFFSQKDFKLPTDVDSEEALKSALIEAALSGASSELSKMSDGDVDYVVKKCLTVCQRRQQGDLWAPVSNTGGLMFEDIDLQVLLRLSIEVVKSQLSGFFVGAAGLSAPGSPTSS